MQKRESLKTPVLLLCFNRPEKTQRVFDSIRAARPTKLYVAVDAPREGRQDDIENNNTVKSIVKNVDWPCEAHYLCQEKNIGCAKSCVTAWNWVFEHEDRAIVIEDDGVGSLDAFYFVEDMLEKYKDDERIAYVGTVNYGPKFGEASYFFSHTPGPTYFMGTWKRVQNLYEFHLDSYNKCKRELVYHFYNEKALLNAQFAAYVESIKQGRPYNTADLQLLYLTYKYDMLCINPNVNLTSNIGLEGGANNAVPVNSKFYKEYGNRKTEEIDTIKHPEFIGIDYDFEEKFFKKRNLYMKSLASVLGKIYFLRYFGGFYKKYIKPLRRR